MKNRNSWQPTKFILKQDGLRANRSEHYVRSSSRLLVDLIGRFYGDKLPEHARGELLDLGCGHVPLFEAYRPFISENCCVDWEGTWHKNEFLDQTQDLNEPLQFESNRFDTLILSDVLEHIREPSQLLQEMHRVCRKDATLIMNVPFFYWLHEEPHDYFRFTRHALVYLVEKAGFEVISVEPLGGAPEVLADFCAKILRGIPVIGKGAGVLVQRLVWAFISTGTGKKVSEKTGRVFPLAYGLVARKPD